MLAESTPDISVILIVGPKRKRSAEALASILGQAEIERAEIILIDVALDRFPPIAGSDHPQVRTIQMGDELHIGAMRAYAARVARSPLVAYLEEHSLALPGWLKVTLATFARGDWAGVGGVVVPTRSEPGLGTLITMISFFPWTEGAPSGEVDILPGHNTAYRRDLLLAIGNDLDQMMLIEITLQNRLREQGYKLYLDNRIKWIHLNEDRADRLFFNYFNWNVLFGQHRVNGRSRAYRLLRIITTPLILPVRMVRSLRSVALRAGKQWPVYAWLLPYILLLHLVDTLGLGLGYLGGWKNHEKALTYGELAIERESSPNIKYVGDAASEVEMYRSVGK